MPPQLHGFANGRFSIWTKGLTSGTGYHRVSKEGIILINDTYLTIFFILLLCFSPLVKSFNVNLIWRTTWLSNRHVHILLLNRNVSKVHGCPRLVLWVNNWPISNLAIFTNIFISNYRQKQVNNSKSLNSLKGIGQNHWTMQYRSLNYIHSFRSMFVSHWTNVPSIFIHQLVFEV